MKKIGITGIDTGVGKTIVSAIVTEALRADYWKLVQAGDLDELDSSTVSTLISNQQSKIHPEQYLLSEPMSPHAAAKIDDIDIKLSDFKVPETSNNLVIEGAGGILVPLNETGDTVGDLFKMVADEVILVSKHYLGSINHSLLSLSWLKSQNIPVTGIIFVGEENPDTESIILHHSQVKCLGRIPVVKELSQEFVRNQAEKIAQALKAVVK